MPGHECAACREPVADTGVICHGCTRKLALLLRDVPALIRDLDVTVTRQSRTRPGTGPGAGGGEIDPVRMPFHVEASDAREHLEWTVLAWARSPELEWPTPRCPGTPAGCALWLERHMGHARRQEWAGDFAESLVEAVGRARRAVDIPAELVFAGPCPTKDCGQELWARPEAATTVCRGCEQEHDLEALRASRMMEARHAKAPAETIARALTAQGRHLTAERIHKWRARGKIHPAGFDPTTGRALYRLGDVTDLLARMDARPAVKARRRRRGGAR